MDLLGEMGFIINHGKSNLTARQIALYIGYVFDTSSMRISLPFEKTSKISDSARAIISPRTCSVRALARIIGLIVSSFRAVLPAKLHYRSLERLKLQTLKVSHGNFDVTLSLAAVVPTCCGGHIWVTCIMRSLFGYQFTSSPLQLMPRNLVGERYLKASVPGADGHPPRPACI